MLLKKYYFLMSNQCLDDLSQVLQTTQLSVSSTLKHRQSLLVFSRRNIKSVISGELTLRKKNKKNKRCLIQRDSVSLTAKPREHAVILCQNFPLVIPPELLLPLFFFFFTSCLPTSANFSFASSERLAVSL